MGDRVSTPVLPGYTSNYLNEDFLVGTLGVATTITRVVMRHTDYDDGGATDTSVTGSIRNATAGGGSGISFTIADQTHSKVATGSLAVAADESIYLRLTAGGNSMNLSGWVEVDAAAGITTALTNLARVKQFLGMAGSDDDDLLNNLIAAVSAEIQNWLDRAIIQATATEEKVDSIGDHRLILDHYPIISITSLYEDDVQLTEDTDFEANADDLAAGQVVRISSGEPCAWDIGRRIVKVTYEHGYATVPYPLVQAATELVAFDYKQAEPGGSRLGLSGKALDTGGSSAYTTRNDLWAAQLHRLAPYQRKAF